MILVGGAEAYLVKEKLASEQVPVILAPARCIPDSWDTRRCREDSYKILSDAGIQVGLGTYDVDNVRNLVSHDLWFIGQRDGKLELRE